MIRAVKGEIEFSTDNQPQAVKDEMGFGIKTWDDVNNTKLEGIVNNLKIFDRRLYIRAKQTGSWLTIQGTTLNGTVLLAMEFSNFLCARYKVTPLI